ncbi:MAG TPA: response regulator [Gaiellaceae bacterium]|nr:response regulator [Gaiellaceae bacterium]
MIRTLVVDDDFMAASVHREFTERVPGFEVVGEATTGVDALRSIEALRPDLVLLDVYLPDLSGIEVLRRLRSSAHAHPDVIAITSAKDVNVLREAMHLGVVHYIVKPFTFTMLKERLETYASLKTQLDHLQEAEQPEIDRLYQLLRTRNIHDPLPKGISAPTLAHVVDILRDSGAGLSSAELAARANLSQGIARRYLRFLADSGTVNLSLRYAAAGRPEHIYRWAAQTSQDRVSPA